MLQGVNAHPTIEPFVVEMDFSWTEPFLLPTAPSSSNNNNNNNYAGGSGPSRDETDPLLEKDEKRSIIVSGGGVDDANGIYNQTEKNQYGAHTFMWDGSYRGKQAEYTIYKFLELYK